MIRLREERRGGFATEIEADTLREAIYAWRCFANEKEQTAGMDMPVDETMKSPISE